MADPINGRRQFRKNKTRFKRAAHPIVVTGHSYRSGMFTFYPYMDRMSS